MKDYHFHTILRDIQFRTVEDIPNQQAATILKAIDKVIDLYERHGLKVIWIYGNTELQPLVDTIHGIKAIKYKERHIHMNIVAANDHMGEIERSIQSVKEIVQSTMQGLPYRRYPKTLLVNLIRWCVSRSRQATECPNP